MPMTQPQVTLKRLGKMDNQILVEAEQDGQKIEMYFPADMKEDDIKTKVRDFFKNDPKYTSIENLEGIDSMTNPTRFDSAVDYVLNNEGGTSDHKNDTGGLTKYGISQNNHPEVDVKSLTPEKAKDIYKTKYWTDLYEQFKDDKVAVKTFDLAVNAGPKQAHTLLQRALNRLLPPQERVNVDGKLGPVTVESINKVDENQLLTTLASEQESFYKRLVQKHPSKGSFLDGWINRAKKLPT